ncbi:hypothetical protein [Phenylobacterium montanum]|uniref:Uncharacterized protein n=1 Tax=Phenylobacterium montanum TaxID=2823693 RepID=A0A975FX26_9CAUL|nr:hypothetical protein [Caulobacter sp. S6]QUD87058.1 hypothetical protein KCG34_18605 [Caulobacter sp. S6]
MSCDVAVAAFLMFASAGDAQQARLILADAAAPASVAGEPLFHDIVLRAAGLKSQVETWRAGIGQAAGPVPLSGFEAFSARIGELSALDENGHKLLVSRGAADDLKCILHGIAQDLPAKLEAVKAAKTGHEEDLALRDIAYLLNDNVEVITAPPQPPA